MVPNLDAMEYDELRAFSKTYLAGKNWSLLFPVEKRGFGKINYKQITSLLSQYADWKTLAIDDRKAGHITAAQGYEKQCEVIYKKLPDWAKW